MLSSNLPGGKYNILVNTLVGKITTLHGKPAYSIYLPKSRQWGIYDLPRKKGHRAYVQPRAGRKTCTIAVCSGPNLLIIVDEERATKAGITAFDDVRAKGNRGRPEAYWYIPFNDNSKLNLVAGYLARI